MEIPGRRSNYSHLSQVDDQTPPANFSDVGEKIADRVGSMFPPSIGLQKQSSGSSYGESSLSSDYYLPSISLPASDHDGFSYLHDVAAGGGGRELRLTVGDGGSSSSKSLAQQTEESYQLQLALALRLSSEAACVDDSNFLDPVPDEPSHRLSTSETAESTSHRFWVNGCLSYSDKIPDGFYLIHGLDPYVWTVCSVIQENGRIPSIDLLKSVDPRSESSIEVVLIDRLSDSYLKEMQNMVHTISSSCITPDDVVDQLANSVCNRLGVAPLTREDELVQLWEETCDGLMNLLRTLVLPIGSLTSGLCRHRALLFKGVFD